MFFVFRSLGKMLFGVPLGLFCNIRREENAEPALFHMTKMIYHQALVRIKKY